MKNNQNKTIQYDLKCIALYLKKKEARKETKIPLGIWIMDTLGFLFL